MRYLASSEGVLDNPLYSEKLKQRGRKNAVIERTVDFKGLKGKNYEVVFYGLWNHSSSLHKISQESYGTMEYWWTIGLINNKPTDQHFEVGDEIYIPKQPNLIKNTIGGQ